MVDDKDERMSEDELRAAYDRFDAMSNEDVERLDGICAALQDFMGNAHQANRSGIILPNRVAAMLAVEAAKAWEDAEWARH